MCSHNSFRSLLAKIFDIMSAVSIRSANPLPKFGLIVLTCALAVAPGLLSGQNATAPSRLLEPGPKPADVSDAWKQLVGIYGQVQERSNIILERHGSLLWRTSDGKESAITSVEGSRYIVYQGKPELRGELSIHRDKLGKITSLQLARTEYLRADAGSDMNGFYNVTPSRPIEQLREEAMQDTPPTEKGPFRQPDLVEISPLDPAVHLDIRYAQSNNFLSTPVYSQARAFLQRPAADALLRALYKLQPLGYGLLIHDAYRPWYVTKIFWDATPSEGHAFVADPAKGSKHNRGCAVDITLYDLSNGRPIQMPGLYDEMSPRSYPTFPGGTSLQRWHRDLLRRAMESEGFTVNEDEWWHFDYKDWKHYPILNVSFEKLAKD